MKKNFIYFSVIAATMMFAACASNDVEEANNGSTDGTGAKLEIGLDQSTRVTTEADATNGVLTKWSDNEKINSYHKYKNKGVAQSLMTLPFTNQSGNVQKGLFTYTNGTTTDYRFNPGNMIYLFNNLNSDIASNYTVAANTSTSVFTLTLKNLQNQTGTVAGLAAYDGMYGTLSAAAVNDAKTVGPANTHHLTSVIRFDLTNADFANNTVSNINMWNAPYANNNAYNPETTAGKTMTANAIIPSSGVFTLNADGTLAASPTLTGYSKWSPSSSITASSGTASVYLMTLPFQNVAVALLTFNAKCGSNYYEREMWIDGLSLTSGAVTTKKVSLAKVPQPYTSYPYYKWDAAQPANVSGNVAGTGSIQTIGGVKATFATQSCKDCPTFDEICMYVAAGTYWDRYKAWVDFQGNLQHGGLWMKKKAYITGFADGTAEKATTSATAYAPGDWISAKDIDRTQYFFLPAAGMVSVTATGTTSTIPSLSSSSNTYYWSNQLEFSGYGYRLSISPTNVNISSYPVGTRGWCIWPTNR